MKRLILILVLIISLGSVTYAKEPVLKLEIPKDKKGHMIAGMTLMSITKVLEIKNGMTLVLLAGIGKEVYDFYTGGTVETGDVIYTLGGAVLFNIVFEYKF